MVFFRHRAVRRRQHFCSYNVLFSAVKLFPCADRGPQGRVSNPPLRCRLAEAGARGCAGGSDRNGHALAPNPQALPPRALCSSDPGTRAIAQGLSGRPWGPDRVRGDRLERMTKHDDSRHLRTLGPSSRPTVREWRDLGSIQETSSGVRRRDSSTTRSCGPLRSE